MKRVLAISFLVFLFAFAGCGNEKKVDLDKAIQIFEDSLTALKNRTDISEDEFYEMVKSYAFDTYSSHLNDSLGLESFVLYSMVNDNAAEVIAAYDNDDSGIIRQSDKVTNQINILRNELTTSVGSRYVDIEGPDAISGDAISISKVLSGGKPVLVDFWASWCAPCKQEIRNHLLNLSKEGKVNIIGIAVWERSVDNTVGAINDLGITWPVIYSGGTEDSPSTLYGVVGVPTLVLISADGTILARGHSIEEFEDVINSL